MGPSLGAQRRSFAAAQREEEVFACEKFTVARISRDRYRYRDALTVHIKSAAELDEIMRASVEESQRLVMQLALGRQALRKVSSQSDTPPPAEIVRRVQIEPPPVRAVPPLPPRDKAATEEPPPAIVDKAERVYRAPPRRTRTRATSPVNDGAVLAQPAAAKAADKAPNKPKRRTGGLAYLRRLLAAQQADAVCSAP
jgi:hypothetical protein